MAKKVLLLSPKAGREENLLNQVRQLFATTLQFREATVSRLVRCDFVICCLTFGKDDFYSYSLSESARRDAERDEERVSLDLMFPSPPLITTSQGVFTGGRREPDLSHNLPDILVRIRDYGSKFSEKAQTIVHGLQSHPDLDCRFLGVRLSFSDFYKTKRDQAQQKS